MTSDTTITAELLDQLLANYEKPEDLTGADGLFKQLKKALIYGAEVSPDLISRVKSDRVYHIAQSLSGAPRCH